MISSKEDVLEIGFQTGKRQKLLAIGLLERKDGRTKIRKLYIAADVDVSWEKVRQTRPSHSIK